jgi:acyl phosphate:glycerol-3-phosphate acyltransferase
MLPLGIIIVLSYFVGSIPTSIIVSRLARGIDIRDHGSGNAGGTNVIRILGLKVGLLVIAVDIFKGYVATILVPKLMYGPMPFNNLTPFEDLTVIRIIAGCSAILGHIWTAFGGFRGGKGIATAGGVLIGLAPIELLVSLAVFLFVFAFSGYVSLGSLSAAISFPLAMFFRHNIFHGSLYGYNTLIFFSMGISLLLVFTHRKNIKRLVAGTENRLMNTPLVKKWLSKRSSTPKQ